MEGVSYYEREGLWDRPLTPQEQERIDLVHAAWPDGVKTVLDVGCGNGALGNFLPGGVSVTGLDFSRAALHHFRGHRILGSVGRLPFRDRGFDLVICADTLEHLRAADFDACLAELRRVAGRFLLIVSPHGEDLEAGSTRCLDCGTVFHVNWHVRSLTRDEFEVRFGDAFRLQSYTFFGQRWERWHPLVIRLAQAFGRRFVRWEDAVCPLCGVRQGDLAGPVPAGPLALLEELERVLPVPTDPGDDRCEVLLLFERGCQTLGSRGDCSRAPRLLLIPDAAKPGPMRFVLRDRGIVHMGSSLCASAVTGPDPERAYVITNELTDWGEPYWLDGRWVRNFQDCGGRDGHALLVLPWPSGAPGTIAISDKDVTGEAMRLEVYDARRGYLAVGTLAGAGSGEWRDTTFPLPSRLEPGRNGLLAHFVPDGGAHPREPHPIAHVGYPGHSSRSLPLDPGPSTAEAGNVWTVNYPLVARRARDEVVLETREPCVMLLLLPTGERYVLGKGKELSVPGWLHDVLQGDSRAIGARPEPFTVQRAPWGERDAQVSALATALAERAVLAALQATLEEREAQLGAVRVALEEREAQLGAVRVALEEREAQLGAVRVALEEREAQLGAVRVALEEREAEVGALGITLNEREMEVARLREALSDDRAQREREAATAQATRQGLQADIARLRAEVEGAASLARQAAADFHAYRASIGIRQVHEAKQALRRWLGRPPPHYP